MQIYVNVSSLYPSLSGFKCFLLLENVTECKITVHYFISLKLGIRLVVLVLFVQYEDADYQDQNETDEHHHHVQPDPHVVHHHDLGVSLLRVQQSLRLF